MSEKRRDNRNRILNTGESQRKDGRYAFKFIDTDGKPKFLYSWRLVATDRVPRGKRQCRPLREMEREVRRDMEDGIDHAGAKMSVCQLYQRYTSSKANVRPGTVTGREQLLRILREDEIGSRAIGDVKPTDAKGWARRMSAKGYAYMTISNHKRSLKAAFYTAVQDDLIRKNPFGFKLSDVIERDTKAKEPLSREQEEALLSFMRTDPVYSRYYDEVVILLGTGLRISELCGLTESDIDFGERSIRIDHQLLYGKGGRYVAEPKTDSGVRVIYMSDGVRRVLLRVLGKQRHEGVTIDGHSGFLFLTSRGTPRSAQGYAAVFRGLVAKYAKGDGPALPGVMTPHTLRHTFCTNMALAGMNPKMLQYVMGHANIQMTLGYYAHATSETAMDEMRRIAA